MAISLPMFSVYSTTILCFRSRRGYNVRSGRGYIFTDGVCVRNYCIGVGVDMEVGVGVAETSPMVCVYPTTMLCYRSGRGDGAGDSLRQLVLQHPRRLHPVLLLREHGPGGAMDSLRQRVEHLPLCGLDHVRQ